MLIENLALKFQRILTTLRTLTFMIMKFHKSLKFPLHSRKLTGSVLLQNFLNLTTAKYREDYIPLNTAHNQAALPLTMHLPGK